MRVSKN